MSSKLLKKDVMLLYFMVVLEYLVLFGNGYLKLNLMEQLQWIYLLKEELLPRLMR